MSVIRFRLSGSRDEADAVIAGLHGMNGVAHVEEVHDLTPRVREYSSPSESTADGRQPIYLIEVNAEGSDLAEAVRRRAKLLASDSAAGIEFIDEF